jgi:prevent-host-death family protein
MYRVKGFSVAEARARFGDLLDQAEQGQAVVIERRGVRFALTSEAPTTKPSTRPFIEWVDPELEAGEWTWDLTRSGARLRTRRAKTR